MRVRADSVKRTLLLLGLALCAFLVVRAAREDAGVILKNLEFGRRFRTGADLYAGNLHTPYPPSYGLLCGPLSLLPETLARIAWAMLQVACLVVLLARFHEVGRERWPDLIPHFHWIAAAALVLGSRFILRDTAGGGGNLIYATLVVEAVRGALRNRIAWAATALGFVLALKPTPVVFLFFLAVARPAVAALAAVCGLVFFVSPSALHGTEWFGEQAWRWLRGVMAYARQEDVFATPDYGLPPFTWMNQSLRCALGRFLGDVPAEFRLDSPLWCEGAGLAPHTVAWITRAASAVLLGVAVASTAAHRRSRQALLFDAAAFFPLTVLLSPISWKAHRVALLFPFFLLVAQALRGKRPGLVAALSVYFLSCGVLSEQMTGKHAKNVLQSLYLITAGDLLVFGLCVREAWRAGRAEGMHPTPAVLLVATLVLGGCATGPPPCETPECEPLPGRTVYVGGVRMHVAMHGRGEPIVFLHGIPTSSYLWRNVQRELEDRWWTIAPDLMGLGKSERPLVGGIGLDAQADAVVGLMDSLGIRQAVLVAHDVGGGVAQIFSARHPKRLRALVLVDVVAFAKYWPVTMVSALSLPFVGEVASLAPNDWILRAALARGLHRDEVLTSRVADRYLEPLADRRGRFRFLEFVRAMDPERVEEALRKNAELELPVLILWGKHDDYQPVEEGVELHRAMRRSRLVIVPEAGHFLPEERPRVVADEIERFLVEVGVRGK